MRYYFGQRRIGNQAKIGRAGRGVRRFGVDFVALLVQIEFVRAEVQGSAAIAGSLHLHAQSALVKIAGSVNMLDRQHQMVEAIHLESHTLRG